MRHGKHQLLVVEDNDADIQLLRFTFEEVHLPFEFIAIRDGEQALAWVRRNSGANDSELPDLAIVDLNLPRHDGVEVLEAMRASSSLAHVPVLVLSSSPRPSDISRVSAFANTRYLTKPTSLEAYTEIAEIVTGILKKHQ